MHDYCKAHDRLHLEMNDSHVTKYTVTYQYKAAYVVVVLKCIHMDMYTDIIFFMRCLQS
jgi:hypothetical protein